MQIERHPEPGREVSAAPQPPPQPDNPVSYRLSPGSPGPRLTMAGVVVRRQDYRFLHPILRLYTQEPSALEVGDEPHPTAVARLISEHHVVEDLFGTYRHDVSYTRIRRAALVTTPQLPRMRFVLIVVLTPPDAVAGGEPGDTRDGPRDPCGAAAAGGGGLPHAVPRRAHPQVCRGRHAGGAPMPAALCPPAFDSVGSSADHHQLRVR